MSEFDRCRAALRNISENVRGIRTLVMVAFPTVNVIAMCLVLAFFLTHCTVS